MSSPWLRQNTAVDIPVGPFVDSVDGDTEETGLTITQPDIRLKKNGGAWGQKSGAQTLAHEEHGWYECALSATDTDTLGILTISIHETGALFFFQTYMVVPADVYDGLVAGSVLATNIAATLAAVDPEVAQIKAKTDMLPADTAAELATIVGFIDPEVAQIKAVTDALVLASGRVEANVTAIDDSETAAVRLGQSGLTLVLVTVGPGATVTSIPLSACDPAAVATNQYVGRVLIFTSTTATTALRGQGARITASAVGGPLTTDAFTIAPASGDVGVIL